MADDEAATAQPPPEGVEPLFLTMTTQDKFGCKTDTLSPDDPLKWISKKDILADVQFRGVISDFHPAKDKIKNYPEEDLALIYDHDEIYGQNFFLCVTVEAKDAQVKVIEEKKAAAEAATAKPEASAPEEDEGPVSKTWVSLGSESEIEEATTKRNRDLLVLSITRKRREFGIGYKFSDRDAHDGFIECRPFKDPNFELKRMEHDVAVQAIPATHDARTQTTWFRPVNKGIQYTPMDIPIQEKKKVRAGGEMIDFLRGVRGWYEEALQQNETIDIFKDDFADLAEEDTSLGNKADNDIKELQSFNHLLYCQDKLISAIDWHPHGKGVVAVACALKMTFDERVEIAGKVQTGVVLVWNFADPIHPQFVLEVPGDVFCFKFNPTNPDIVVGGITSGQIAMWDISEAKKEVKQEHSKSLMDEEDQSGTTSQIVKFNMLSSIEHSHRRTVTDLAWLPGHQEITGGGKMTQGPENETNQFVTIAADGQVLFWDLRLKKDSRKNEVSWHPVFRMTLSKLDGTGELGGSFIILNGIEHGSKFFCVTEEGEFVTVELGDTKHPDDQSRGVKAVCAGHFGPCTALQRSPFVHDILLSVGDWTFNIWKDGIAAPIFTSPFAPCYLTCGCWSPTRPAVVFTAKSDGSIDIWDLVDRSHEPSMGINITSAAIASISFFNPSSSQLLAVGDDQGTVHIMEIPRNLRRQSINERSIMAGFFEREVKRVEYVQVRAEIRREELAQKERQQQQAEGEGGDEAPSLDQFDEKAEAEYRAMEEAFKKEMGIVDENAEEQQQGRR